MKTNLRTETILGMLIESAKQDVAIIQDVHPALVNDRNKVQLAQDDDYKMAQVLFMNMMNNLLKKNNHRYYGQNFYSINEIDEEIEAMDFTRLWECESNE
jgi:hypothetical protein